MNAVANGTKQGSLHNKQLLSASSVKKVHRCVRLAQHLLNNVLFGEKEQSSKVRVSNNPT